MRKDGTREKFERELREAFQGVLTERIPDDIRALVEKLK